MAKEIQIFQLSYRIDVFLFIKRRVIQVTLGRVDPWLPCMLGFAGGASTALLTKGLLRPFENPAKGFRGKTEFQSTHVK